MISLLSVLFALLTKQVIDSAVNDQPVFGKYALLLVMTVLSQYILNSFLQYLDESAVTALTGDLRKKMLNDLMDQDYQKVRKLHSGEWVNRMFSDVNIVASGCVGILPGAIGMLVRLFCACGALLFLEPLFSVIYICAGVLMIIVISFLRRYMKQLHKKAQREEDHVHSWLQEIMTNLLVIKAFSGNEHIIEKTDHYHDDWRIARLKRRRVSIAANTSFSMTFRLGYVFALLYGLRNLMAGVTTYGTIMAVLQLVNQVQLPVARLSGVLTRIYEVSASCERIMEAEYGSHKQKQMKNTSSFRSLTFDHVTFSYDRDIVLDDISFKINRGEITGFTGISGGGKSTMFLLTMGVYKPQKGNVLIETDQGSVNAEDNSGLLFAYVPQENMLFTGTIAENVCFNHERDDVKLRNALHTACADLFVNELPEKENTFIKDGKGLSEGQLQRLAIARAIYSDADVILLDEATSALDEETERNVLNHIHELSDKTILIVTHRKAALDVCDHHIHLENGKLIEHTDER